MSHKRVFKIKLVNSTNDMRSIMTYLDKNNLLNEFILGQKFVLIYIRLNSVDLQYVE